MCPDGMQHHEGWISLAPALLFILRWTCLIGRWPPICTCCCLCLPSCGQRCVFVPSLPSHVPSILNGQATRRIAGPATLTSNCRSLTPASPNSYDFPKTGGETVRAMGSEVADNATDPLAR